MRGSVDTSPTAARRRLIVLQFRQAMPSAGRMPSLGSGRHTTLLAWMSPTTRLTVESPGGIGAVPVYSGLSSLSLRRSTCDPHARRAIEDSVRTSDTRSQRACLTSGSHTGMRALAMTSPTGIGNNDTEAVRSVGSPSYRRGDAFPDHRGSPGTPSGQPEPSGPSAGSRCDCSLASESPPPRRRSRSRHNSDRPTQTGIPSRNSPTVNSPSTGVLRGSRIRSETPRRESQGRPCQRF